MQDESKTENLVLLLPKRPAAAALGISVRSLENYIASKEIKVRKLGRRTLIPVSELRRFARSDHSAHKKQGDRT